MPLKSHRSNNAGGTVLSSAHAIPIAKEQVLKEQALKEHVPEHVALCYTFYTLRARWTWLAEYGT